MPQNMSSPRTRDISLGIIIGILISLLSLASMTYAASGGRFGEVLNLILTGDSAGNGTTTWENTLSGTVHNARSLSGKTLDKFQIVSSSSQSCMNNQCVYGFDATGKILCR